MSFVDSALFMGKYFYEQWYREDVSAHLSDTEKDALMRKISELTLREAIWLNDKNYITEFPELEPYSHTKQISGLQLVAVMEECLKDLTEKKGR